MISVLPRRQSSCCYQLWVISMVRRRGRVVRERMVGWGMMRSRMMWGRMRMMNWNIFIYFRTRRQCRDLIWMIGSLQVVNVWSLCDGLHVDLGVIVVEEDRNDRGGGRHRRGGVEWVRRRLRVVDDVRNRSGSLDDVGQWRGRLHNVVWRQMRQRSCCCGGVDHNGGVSGQVDVDWGRRAVCGNRRKRNVLNSMRWEMRRRPVIA